VKDITAVHVEIGATGTAMVVLAAVVVLVETVLKVIQVIEALVVEREV
jgi:hypothetical protein